MRAIILIFITFILSGCPPATDNQSTVLVLENKLLHCERSVQGLEEELSQAFKMIDICEIIIDKDKKDIVKERDACVERNHKCSYDLIKCRNSL